MKYYPLFMNLEGRECLVVGAGAVAARKARSLLECGAKVTVIGENPVPSLRRLEGEGLRIRARKFRSGDLGSCALVFGATDDAVVNGEIYRESRRRGLPVNVADQPELCTFIVPSLYRRGDLAIAVSTGGKSPAAARAIREDLEERYGREYAELAALLGAERDRMIQSVPGHRRRAALWKSILAEGVLDILRRDGKGEAKAFIRRRIDEEAGRGGEP
jgi:precorrin-2 dehydrogenase/sirohydrochlorin ferrochelatase